MAEPVFTMPEGATVALHVKIAGRKYGPGEVVVVDVETGEEFDLPADIVAGKTYGYRLKV